MPDSLRSSIAFRSLAENALASTSRMGHAPARPCRERLSDEHPDEGRPSRSDEPAIVRAFPPAAGEARNSTDARIRQHRGAWPREAYGKRTVASPVEARRHRARHVHLVELVLRRDGVPQPEARPRPQPQGVLGQVAGVPRVAVPAGEAALQPQQCPDRPVRLRDQRQRRARRRAGHGSLGHQRGREVGLGRSERPDGRGHDAFRFQHPAAQGPTGRRPDHAFGAHGVNALARAAHRRRWPRDRHSGADPQ